MITKISVAHETTNFFGATETRLEERRYNIQRQHVLKVLKYVRDDNGEHYPYAHFDVDGGLDKGGTHECVYQQSPQRGTDMLTWEHWVRPNAKDRYTISYKEILKESRKWIVEPTE